MKHTDLIMLWMETEYPGFKHVSSNDSLHFEFSTPKSYWARVELVFGPEPSYWNHSDNPFLKPLSQDEVLILTSPFEFIRVNLSDPECLNKIRTFLNELY